MALGLWRGSAAACLVAAFGLSAGFSTTVQADDFDWPRMLRIATPGTASGSFASTNGWAPVLQNQTGMTVRVVPEDSEPTRYTRLTQRNEFEVASVSSAEVRFQMEGIDGYAAMPPAPLRIIWHHNDTPWGFVVRGDSDIESIYDLKREGVRVSLSSQSPPMMRTVREALPKFLGMTEEEAAEKWTFVPAGSYVENCRSVTDGRADVAWCAPISAVLSEMEGHPRGIRWLDQPLDDTEGWEGWLSVRPAHVPAEITMGVETALGTHGLVSNFLYWTTPDQDEDLIYNLAKWFNEQHDSYKGTHALAARMSLEHFRNYLDGSPLPVHAGTVRYLREIGAWTEEDDEWNEAAKENVDAWMEARRQGLEAARAAGVRPHWEDPDFQAIMREHTEGLPIFRTRL